MVMRRAIEIQREAVISTSVVVTDLMYLYDYFVVTIMSQYGSILEQYDQIL
jgi:hypothetical protein